MKYEVHWVNFRTDEDKTHGQFPTREDAIKSVYAWWEKNKYTPNYIRQWTVADGTTTLDYGFHHMFYIIKELPTDWSVADYVPTYDTSPRLITEPTPFLYEDSLDLLLKGIKVWWEEQYTSIESMALITGKNKHLIFYNPIPEREERETPVLHVTYREGKEPLPEDSEAIITAWGDGLVKEHWFSLKNTPQEDQ